jgi:hypothetical protein
VSAPRAAIAALLAILLSAAPAAAQQSGSPATPATPAARPPTLSLQPHPAALAAPPPSGQRLAPPGQTDDCAPAWPCQLRAFGFTGKYGGVGLKGTALTW